jgi:subtilase family serine protease
MKIRFIATALSAAVVAAATASALPAASAPVPVHGLGASTPPVRAACGPARYGQARCFALYTPQVAVNKAIAARAAGKQVPVSAASPKGWGATAIESAYKLPVSHDPHQTVAVVDAMSAPHLAADLAHYREHYRLPRCGAASGCLRIVNQVGKASPLPPPDPLGWGIEETLDVAMVSAACPHCKILLVEAKSASVPDVAAAEDTAARLGAQVISNSYGAREDGFVQTFARAYHHPGHAIVASSGDLGYTAANFPANLATVTAAGGTQLARASNRRGWSEQVWRTPGVGASGSGCSAYVAKPAWQRDPHCPGRTVADVAAVAWDIPIYDSSVTSQEGGPWLSIGGTSASAPLIAGIYALAGNASHVTPRRLYQRASSLYDIVAGNNSVLTGNGPAACGRDYLCVAKPGYDAPTGLGSPHGTGAF